MAISEITICNHALMLLGQTQLITTLDEESTSARLCNSRYEGNLEELLYAYQWPSCMKRASLATPIDTVPWGSENVFELPADCIRIMKMNKDITQDWRVEGGFLLTDSNTAEVKYVFKNTVPTTYEPSMRDCLSARLAWQIAYALTGSNTVADRMLKEFEHLLSRAKSHAAQSSGTPDTVGGDQWAESRQAGWWGTA